MPKKVIFRDAASFCLFSGSFRERWALHMPTQVRSGPQSSAVSRICILCSTSRVIRKTLEVNYLAMPYVFVSRSQR